MRRLRVLLLNPPGDKVYIRDYYCSKVSKANYTYEPLDLLLLSGILSQRHEVLAIDAIASKLTETECLARIVDYKPDATIFITGSVSYKTDFEFLKKIKSAHNTLLIGSGDIFMEDQIKQLQENTAIDAILLDFTDPSILEYLDGRYDSDNIISRKQGQVIQGRIIRRHGEEFHIPQPRHELFPLSRYNYPFVREKKFATVLTDYGCPYKCTFCIMSQIGHKMRLVEDVIQELRGIKAQGITEVYFDDQTFAANKKRTFKLLERMIEERLDIGWCCFSRVDVLDEGLIRRMKAAGCHTIMFGVESGNEAILNAHNKGITKSKVIEAFRLCRRYGITTVATFIIGLPEETHETAEETVKFSLESGCDYASYNVAVPRMGTILRENAIRDKLIDSTVYEMDQSGSKAILKTRGLTISEVERLKNQAIKRFYFRYSFLLKELFRIKTLYDITSRVNGFYGVMRNMLG